MNFLEKLDRLMKSKGLNKNTLASKSGIPYTTIYAFYKKGYEKVKLSTLRKLAETLDTTLDYLVCDDITNPDRPNADPASPAAQPLLAAFDKLNPRGQAVAVERVEELTENPKYTEKPKEKATSA